MTNIQRRVIKIGKVTLLVAIPIMVMAASNRVINSGSLPFSSMSNQKATSTSNQKPLEGGLPEDIEEKPVATKATTPPPTITVSDQLRLNLSAEANTLYAAIDPAVERLKPQYQEAATAVGIPWQVLPALHLREAGRGMSDQHSILNGAKLSTNPDPAVTAGLFKESLRAAAAHYKVTTKSIGGIDIKPEGNTLAEIKRAFLIYSRSYKANAQDPDASPYVMNYLDGTRVNMVWPAGDPVAQLFGNNHRDGNPGALTTYIHYGGPIVE